MQGRTNARVCIKSVQKSDELRQQIIALEDLRTQVLPGGEEDVADHRPDLGDNDVFLQPCKILHVEAQEIQQGYYNQEIPSHVGDHEPFAKGDQIVQPNVDRIAAGGGNQIFSQEVQGEIDQPAAQPEQMPELRRSEIARTQLPVIPLRLNLREAAAAGPIVPGGHVRIGNHNVLRQRAGKLCDRVHHACGNPLLFLGNRSIRVKDHGFPEHDLPELRGDVHRDKGHAFSGPLIIVPGHVYEILPEGVDDLIVGLIALREDRDLCAGVQLGDRSFKGRDQSAVVVDGNRVGVVEHTDRNRGDQIGQQLEKPAGPLRLAAPKVLVGVSRNLFPIHHLPGAPGGASARDVELRAERAVHMGMVPHQNAAVLRQVLGPDQRKLRIDQRHDPPNDAVPESGKATRFIHESIPPFPVSCCPDETALHRTEQNPHRPED